VGQPARQLIEERLWVRERDSVLTALGLQVDPRAHLRELADLVGDACTQVAARLAANAWVSIKGGQAAPGPAGSRPAARGVPGRA
jgi:hypothetical protein